MNQPVESYDDLKNQVLALLDLPSDDLDADDNLIDYGLNSMQLMQLMESWTQGGIELHFVDLAETPTLNAWWKILQSRRGVYS